MKKEYEAPATGYGWKSVSIGGVAGILLGAGAMYAANAYVAGDDKSAVLEEPEAENAQGESESVMASCSCSNGLKVANVDESLSFGEAFKAARAEVGAGGVFRWHGGIYNTYTKDEWDSMSAAEKSDFASLVQPEIRPEHIHTEYITATTPDIHVHVHIHNDGAVGAEVTANVSLASNNNYHASNGSADNDVHVVGQGTIEGHAAATIDMTGDGVADVAVIDINDNGILDGEDVVVDRAGNMMTMNGEVLHSADSVCMDSQPDDESADPNMLNTSYGTEYDDSNSYADNADHGILI